MKQADIIKQLSDKELKKQLVLSQCMFFIIGIILSFFLFDHITDWIDLFHFHPKHILYYGILPSIGLVVFEMLLYSFLPKKAFDDGGINERIFKGQSVGWIAGISCIVAICEEIIFRGVLQVTFGYVIASSIFALVHVRYLKKPILFLLVVGISFLIGFLFLLTNNLIVTIVFHFMVDFLLGMFIRYKK